MRRRTAIAFLTAAALAPPLAQAQKKRLPRIGYFSLVSIREPASPERQAFLDGLREHGLVPGKSVEIIYRSAENLPEFIGEMFADLLKAQVDVVVVSNILAILAAKKATATLPIVMLAVGDPVGTGLVKSLGRPGGNITGVSFLSTELASKRVQLLRDVLPSVRRIAILWHAPNMQARAEAEGAIAAAQTLRMTADRYPIKSVDDLPRALERMAATRPDALYVTIEAVIVAYSAVLADFGLRNGIPVVSGYSGITEAGGLLSYSPNIPAMYRRSAYYVERILKGTKPAELPVEQASTFELVVNLKTARTLNLSLPDEIRVLADRLIE